MAATTNTSAQKCVHKGCGKVFTDPNAEDCVYHPGPPEFHEGQKGWTCCKPRVLTFDEFLAIPPCTTGKHSAVDDTPAPEPRKQDAWLNENPPAIRPISVTKSDGRTVDGVASATTLTAERTRTPIPQAQAIPRATTPQPQIEEDSDDPDVQILPNSTCKRRACGKSYSPSTTPRAEEICIYHPGVPLFHEGSKGWTCCKRRVLEFDEFMKIGGCKERKQHCYVGKKQKKKHDTGEDTRSAQHGDEEEMLDDVRTDFYQTPSSVIASYFLKKIDKERAKVVFSGSTGERGVVDLDLPTTDGKRFKKKVTFWGAVKAADCSFKILGTKLEIVVVKADGASWPVLREGDPETGERIQVGRAVRA